MVGRSARRSWPGLASFTSTPAGPGRATVGDTGEHRIGSLHRLHRQHDPLLHHAGLTDIRRADDFQHLDAAADIGQRRLVGRRLGQQPGFAQSAAENLDGRR